MTAKRSAPAWRRYLRFWGSNVPGDVDDELRFHVEMRTKEYVARGMSEAAARDAALARLGGVEAARIQCLAIGKERDRQTRQADLLETIMSDVRFGLRSLARSPAWAIVALVTIALGIGASTAVFSVVDRLLVHPVTYPGARRLFVVERNIAFAGSSHAYMNPSAGAVHAWRRLAHSIDAVEGYARRDLLTAAEGGEGQPIHAVSIDTSFLTFAGVKPLVGRAFSGDETAPNGPAVALLSESYWQREFGGARDVVGKVFHANGQTFTIIGVLPASLQLPDVAADAPDVWLPLVDGAEQRLAYVVARVRPGVTADAARDELEAIAARSGIDRAMPGTTAALELARPGDTLRFHRALWMLAGAVALLLLVACTNVAHLLLARSAARERELAVRYALGAGRARLVRQLLTESLVLSALGGAAAVLVAGVALRLVRTLHPANLNALAQIAANRNVVLIAATLTLATGLAVGVLVGLRTARRGLGEALRVGGGGTVRGGRRLRSSLVVTEIALSATLLIGALLLVRGVMNLQGATLGFNAHNLYGVTFSLRGENSPAAQRVAFARDLLARGRTVPGVRGVTLAATVPPRGGWLLAAFETSDHIGIIGEPTTGSVNAIAVDYLSVMEIPLVAGRSFNATSASNNEVIISEAFAKELWAGQGAVGRRFRAGPPAPSGAPAPWWTVVGVTRDAFTHGLLDQQSEPAMYTPLGDLDDGRVTLIVRARDGVDVGPALRQIATSLRPGTSIPAITGVEQALSESLAEPRFAMIVLATFASIAVALAAIGLYGVISYTVAQRTREIGVRMTLGATRGTIARLVVGDGIRLSAIGVVLGLFGGRAMTQIIQSALDGVRPQDPMSFAIGAVLLIAISALACLVPMLRATGVDPVVAMRVD